MCVCAHTSETVLCGEWVGASVSRPGLCSALSCCVLLSAEWKHHVSVGRPEEQPCFSEQRPEQTVKGGLREKEGARWTQPETCSTWSRLSWVKKRATKRYRNWTGFEDSFQPFCHLVLPPQTWLCHASPEERATTRL